MTTQSRGDAFVSSVEEAHELGPDETELLRECGAMLDALDVLGGAVEAEGLMLTDSKGHPVVHPAAIEARAIRESLRKTLSTLGIPDEAGENGRTRSARAAADRRWRRSA